MKLKLKCDRCGITATPGEISTDVDGRDLCAACAITERLLDLKQERDTKMAWLEATHLKTIRELDVEIASLQRARK